MKNIFLAAAFAMSAISAQAAPPKTFSNADYADFVRDGALRFDFTAQAKKDFRVLGLADNDCDQAVLAAIASAEFSAAEQDGVDYPESIDILGAKDSSPMTGVTFVKVQGFNGVSYNVRYYASSVPCLAEQTTITRPFHL